jgi:sulfate permease, SulP family
MSSSPARPLPSISLISSLKNLSGKELASSLVAGVVVGILVIFVEVSLAAMVFSGNLEHGLPQGIGLFLVGALILGLYTTITSSIVPVIALGQDSPAALLAVIAAAIAATLTATDPEHVFGNVIAMMMSASIVTGVVFWIMGRFNLGRLVRFIPYPVVGGFLGGTGWLLMLGGLGVMTDTPLGVKLFAADVFLRWLPGVIFAIALFIILRRYSHFLVLPSIIVSSILLFYTIYYISTGSFSAKDLAEWQLGPFPKGGLFSLVIFDVLSVDHLHIVWGSMVDFGSIIIVSAIALLLNASGLELIYGEDFDLNRELRSVGTANILGGIFGGSPGYHSISLSTLGRKLGANNRLVGLFTSSIVAIALFFGASILSFFPRMIAGGLLVYLGISFLFEWVYDAWFKLPKLDYFLIWLILIVIATVGFLEGVAVGIVVAVLLFVLDYSRVKIVRHDFTAANFSSFVIRPRLFEQLLRQRGESLQILELQGYIFFGSADRLVAQIRARIEDSDLPQLHYLLLDFRLVTGVDSSAALSFSKLDQLTKKEEITLVFSDLNPEFNDTLGKDLCASLQIFPKLEQGLAWCEECIIEVFSEVGLVARPKSIIQLIEDSLAHEAGDKDWLGMIMPGKKQDPSKRASRLLKYLEQIKVQTGESMMDVNEEIKGLFFIEEGQIKVTLPCDDESDEITALLESGTLFGEIDYYAEQKSTVCYRANQPSSLYFLSQENITRMEDEDPQLAIAMHRILAGTLSKKFHLASDTIQALRK